MPRSNSLANIQYENGSVKIEKTALRLMQNLYNRESIQEHFKDVNILNVYSQFIYSCTNYVRDNQPNELKYEHHYSTRNESN